MKNIFLIFVVFSFFSCNKLTAQKVSAEVHHSKLIELFKASENNYPNISVHRGGKGLVDYPENSLEVLQYVSDSISAIYEIDVAQTKDGHLVLMHDNSIDRTTTGSGKVSDLTYDELLKFNMVDDYGNETKFKIPLFSEILAWSKENNVILTVDIKPSVSTEVVIDAIREASAEDICIIITYDVEETKMVYELASDLLISVSARSNEEFDRLLETKIPTNNMIAFTGTRLSDVSLFKRLHDYNIVCMLGTIGNLDKSAEAKGEKLYAKWKKMGIDIIATDRPFAAFGAINM
ncbi:glycerophosphodiester phosphodiesterase family protein [Winogradskyella undariae]|uniref:glycerophosphodiester phosphodiesterase family protein n=1 Tax=Winogradskyella TaxID=286104 RepID=UPI00156B4F16|nr:MULTISPECIES: glycerophosphodiester phosphodiesterase family protein [Winogradskyella]NRR92257.1 glycerophosphodiester phosphodiesterase family protein [Winogradskyella undariae]QXP78278.1 glycerophosphodiester phosphodiesterase family protein [Winogradskyella sp. HaHa_3_26]